MHIYAFAIVANIAIPINKIFRRMMCATTNIWGSSLHGIRCEVPEITDIMVKLIVTKILI